MVRFFAGDVHLSIGVLINPAASLRCGRRGGKNVQDCMQPCRCGSGVMDLDPDLVELVQESSKLQSLVQIIGKSGSRLL